MAVDKTFASVPSVSDFYKDKELLVTGATGFLGKSLLEKLLFGCPDIKCIYLLLRPKRGSAVEKRLEELKKDPAFSRVKTSCPSAMDKLVAIEGDVRELGLRLSGESVQRIQNVSVLVHGAATVRFDEPLKESIIMNTRGTREVLNLAKKLKNLKLFAHLSTAYTNPQNNLTEEKLYPIEADWREVIKMAETLDVELLEALAKKFIGYHPNSYTFSKQVSEHMVNEFRKELPIIIHRPSIVSPSISEPVPGWVDNFNGPVGLMIPIGIGFSRILLGDSKCPLNFVPVDYISNSLIAVIAQSATHLEQTKGLERDEVPIFNYGVEKTKCIKIEAIISNGIEICSKYPMENTVWYPNTAITPSILLYKLNFYFLQLLPGLIAELVLKTFRYNFSILRILRKIYYIQVSLIFFMSKEFDFTNPNTLQSFKILSAEDQAKFPCGGDVEFRSYLTKCLLGAREFLLHQNPKTIPRSIIKFRILQVLHYALTAAMGFYVFIRVLRLGGIHV